MSDLLRLCISIRLWLAAWHPALPLAPITVGLWFSGYVVRRWFPAWWKTLERIVPEGAPDSIANIILAVPFAALGAAFAVTSSGKLTPGMAFFGTLGGGLAPVLHHVLKLLPIPYRGAVREIVRRKWGQFFGGSLLVLLTGCGPNPADEAQRIIDRWSCEDKAVSAWRARAREFCPLPEDCESGKATVCPTWDACAHRDQLEKEYDSALARCDVGGHL